jgi:hypothetical protein
MVKETVLHDFTRLRDGFYGEEVQHLLAEE